MASTFIAKPSVSDLVKGKRLNIGPLTCTGKSHYIRQSWHREDERVYYRHTFRNADGDCFVYTGNPLGVSVGDEVYLRCTIKQVDTAWNCVRIMRPVIVLMNEPGLI